VLADHGEELDEHGCWFDHHGLYETNVRVPLIICPGRESPPAGSRPATAGPVTLLDLAPTVLHAVGLPELPARHRMPGRPLLEPNAAPSAAAPQYLTECTWMRKRGWRTGEWKLIEALEPDIYGKPALELYHLATDPGETRNLAAARPEVAAALRAELGDWVARRLRETGLPDPLVTQADALRTWQPRFIAGHAR
jgi:arylsulfatase A-like enzyme